MKRIEAYGFKSFADKIEIDFDEGITAIVGPNGSGKSNVSDALRWVLGEQSARSLRGSKMEDIIFNGSAKRKALNIADVSIVLDNSSRVFAIDFSEVALTRRMYRSGESEYYINKSPCRLKDIYDLLSGTGIGKDSMSIIGQNKADDILNSKPEERRLLFEEAAGIGKFKNRKREAQKKLDDTNANITRIDDITSELESQLEPLREASVRTEQYNGYFSQLRGLKIDALAIKYRNLAEAEADCIAQETIFSDELIAKDTATTVLESEKEQLLLHLQYDEDAINRLEAAVNRINVDIESGSGKVRLEQERIATAKNRLAALDEETARNHEEHKRIDEAIDDVLATQAATAGEIEATRCAIEMAEQALSTAENLARQAEKELENYRGQAFSRIQDTVSIRNKIRLLQLEKDNHEKQLQRNLSGRRLIEKEHSEAAGALAVKKAGYTACGIEMSGLAQQQELLDGQIKAATAQHRNNRGLYAAAADELRKMQIRLDTLGALQQNHEGASRAVKSVLTAGQHWQSGIYGIAGELITVNPEYVVAIETALGQAAQNIICDNDETARQAIEMLKKNQQGRATFLPVENLRVQHNEYPLAKLQGIRGIASGLVQCDDKIMPAVKFLLGRTLVAENFECARRAAKTLNYQARIVTLEGELLMPGGAITGGAVQRQTTGMISRKSEIDALRGKISVAAGQAGQYERDCKISEDELRLLEGKAQKCSGLQNELRNKWSAIAVSVEHGEEHAQRLAAQLELNAGEEKQLRQGCENIETGIADTRKMLADSEEQEVAGQIKLEEISANLKERRAEQETAQNEYSKLKLDFSTAQARFDSTAARNSDLTASKNNCNEALQRLQNERKQLKNTIFRAETEIAGAGAQILELKAERVDVNNRLSAQFENKHQKLQRQDQIDKELRSIRRRNADIQLRLTDLRVQAERCRVEKENLQARVSDDFQTDLAAYTPERDELSADDKQKISELEKQIAGLGTINPNAPEEYRRSRDRYEFLCVQRSDLFEAQEKLAVLIAEMDDIMAEQFAEAVKQIDGYFSEIFTRLFGGGSAALVLTAPDNLLETGVEVVVQIPGKRRQNMTLLSGGERALTVIALLFAMLQHRPSPFCVLDELDAALDEANVERFTEFLREYHERTQFVIITHRKRTMEAAEKLHGITMEETGVSQVVSVKFAG